MDDERYAVATPENVTFQFDVAGIGTRFMAALIDGILYAILIVGLNLAYSRLDRIIPDALLASTLSGIFLLFTFALYWVYYILFELLWDGQSPGKRVTGIRVVRLDGAPASPVQIVIRNVVRLVDLFPGFYAVGIIAMFLNSQSRRLGDFAAGTLVVREHRTVSLDRFAARPAAAPGQAPTETAGLSVHRLDREQRNITREFISRRASMAPAQRATLALQIARSLAARMELAPPADPAAAEHLLEQAAGAIGDSPW